MVVPNPNGAGKVLAVNEDEAKTIKRIVERVLAKDSLMQIINDLNKEGVPSPGHSSRQTTGKRSDSKQWYTTTLRSLLGNPQLLGQVIEDGKPILRTDGLPLVNRPPILDTDTWQALQGESERRANPGEKRREGNRSARRTLSNFTWGYRGCSRTRVQARRPPRYHRHQGPDQGFHDRTTRHAVQAEGWSGLCLLVVAVGRAFADCRRFGFSSEPCPPRRSLACLRERG
ncbi:recombinase family protein [Streptomyces sp. NPDC049887]|uniref:recombinase family protein n=1 Tax=unclassified Streptomyces TaxID=2593676 RepID=UPI00341FC0A3